MTDGVSAAMTSAVTSMQGNVLGALTLIAPIALTILGVFLAWKYGIKFFKGLSK